MGESLTYAGDWLANTQLMATGDQIKALLKAYRDSNEPQVLTLALQIAAGEAKAGHGKLAQDIRGLVEELKARGATIVPRRAIPLAQPKGELADLLRVDYPETRLSDLVLTQDIEIRLRRVLGEQLQAARLREYGLEPRRRLLFVGPPGTGKTMSAAALANELSLPLFTLRLESLFTRFMGEAAAKLRVLFDNISKVRGVYLFDEFDALGQQRSTEHDVGEMRRILNSLLQLMEQDTSHSVLVAATNHPTALDRALFRRFDEVVRFHLPSAKEVLHLMRRRLQGSPSALEHLAQLADGLSFADVQRVCDDALKRALLAGRTTASEDDVRVALRDRQQDKKTFSG
jgi:SpoVK/Ycf46/Vps4 family AAA+-type ATPase